ncbi:MFS transporter [Micromonospora endolithica]|uniref:MFS transporter n=1 Tax=Micromonospora endolithica TaxID=230091 RepID=A0A3A9ZDF3_9ACTN|nr:MFS transporter [Micromonospora endolithica]RKN46381.1 MFS transporter [Micromonospora endolithica]TWJ24880.1 MFS-type transporter involved in bile tolerance (Atg22 family) [Micromonospora endolithica]
MTASRPGRDFRLLWSATVTSRFGDSLRTPALALLAATVTRDPRVIAAVTVAGQVPPLLLGLLGGVYADRGDRRRTMALVDGVRAVVVAALAVAVALDRAGVAVLVVAAFLLAALGTFFDAAAFALLPSVVPPEELPRANGRLQAGTAVAGGLVGAPAAGVLFALSAPLPFAVDALTFTAAALLTLTLTPTPVPPPDLRRSCTFGRHRTGHKRHKGDHNCKIAGKGAGAGVRFLWGERTLRGVALVTAGSNLAISGLIAVLVLYALEVLRVPPVGYGLFAATAIVGGVAGALGAGRLAARLGTVATLRVVLVGQTVALTGLALARHPVPGGLALAGFAAGGAVWNSLAVAYGQRHVPPELLGRVGAAQRLVGMVTAPVGAALAGFAGAAYGVAPVAGAAAVVFALVSVAGWWALRPRSG